MRLPELSHIYWQSVGILPEQSIELLINGHKHYTITNIEKPKLIRIFRNK